MHRFSFLACITGGLAFLAVTDARAQEPQTLAGTWKGMAYAVHIGSNPYRVAEKNGPNLP